MGAVMRGAERAITKELRHMQVVSERDTTWCWLEDDGTRTVLTYPVRIVVLDEVDFYQVRAYRLDNGDMIADEPFSGRRARARALAFAAKGWADFEAVEEIRASA